MVVDKDAVKIRRMFAAISPRYDLLNHLLSLNLDKSWRRRTVEALELSPSSRVLDVCAGTADLAFELERQIDSQQGGSVIASDFTFDMVRIAQQKRTQRQKRMPGLFVADTLRLPFASATFDAVTVGFGIRNVAHLQTALMEMFRVLRPGGQVAILEFSTPRTKLLQGFYRFYFHHVLPRIGAWISGSNAGKGAYEYLPQSVAEFPTPDGLTDVLREFGFTDVRYRAFTCGVAVLHVGRRPAETSAESLRRIEVEAE